MNRIASKLPKSTRDPIFGDARPCAVYRSWRCQRADVAIMRRMLAFHFPNGTVVSTLQAVAREFDVETSTVKNHWRDSGMPGQQGAWDLAEILAWITHRDARTRGDDVPLTENVLLDELKERIDQMRMPGLHRVVEDFINRTAST